MLVRDDARLARQPPQPSADGAESLVRRPVLRQELDRVGDERRRAVVQLLARCLVHGRPPCDGVADRAVAWPEYSGPAVVPTPSPAPGEARTRGAGMRSLTVSVLTCRPEFGQRCCLPVSTTSWRGLLRKPVDNQGH